MRVSILGFLLALAVTYCPSAQAQGGLTKVTPVILKSGSVPDTVSFVLTTLDNSLFKRKPQKYSSAIEIIDANAPWPPRWYALHPSDTFPDVRFNPMLMLNATYEGREFRYFTTAYSPNHRDEPAVVTCDRDMNAVDTFFAYQRTMDPHDFSVSPRGEVTYFAVYDTVVDITKLDTTLKEGPVHLMYQPIVIADDTGKTVFTWDPLRTLGFHAVYLPYRYTPSIRAITSSFDWSHCNSLHYDYDGNILFSYKHIGIGKISYKDGHLMWRIDRNNQKINEYSDSLPIYLQHDLQAIRVDQGPVSYTIWSNGDSLHHYCEGYRFSVTYKDDKTPVVKVLERIKPSIHIPNTGGGGNMDEDAAGNYLLNYGIFTQDTALRSRPFFEYKDVRHNKTVQYDIWPSIFAFRIHTLSGWRPARPVIHAVNGELTADVHSESLQWYSLSGTGLRDIKYLAGGKTFRPSASGYYCVAVPHGVGWSVSEAFHYTAKK